MFSTTGDPAMPPARQYACVVEMAQVAERLGATDQPRTRAALSAYLAAMRRAAGVGRLMRWALR